MLQPTATPCNPRLFTVGHSNQDLRSFLDLLERVGITAVADVRSHPHSRRLPHFSGPDLAVALRGRGLHYVFLGDLLGGRPDDPDLYDTDGRVDYERVRTTDLFKRGLHRLRDGMERFVVVLMCSEADPLDCHRGLMITPALVELGIFPEHIRLDGSVESTPDMEQRLLDEIGAEAPYEGLFADEWTAEDQRRELACAYRAMARRKAFRRRPEDDRSWSDGEASDGDFDRNGE
jgi:uncharacterized protein (DUF488 family)